MNIAITGASGFLGPRLAARLHRDGHSIRTIGRRPSTFAQAQHYSWDALAGEPPLEALSDADAVLNLAGEPVAQRWNSEVKRKIQDTRVIGTRNLVSGIRQAGSHPVLVSSSAIGFYGDRDDELLTEVSPPGNDFLASVCIAWEREALRARQFGCRVVVMRTGIALGNDGGALKQMLPAFRAGLGGPVATGRQWVSWIHADDLADLFAFVVTQSNFSGPVNGTAPNPVRNTEFAQALGAALSRPAVVPVPAFGLRLMFGEAASALLASQRVVPEVATRAGFSFRYTDCAAALRQVFGS